MDAAMAFAIVAAVHAGFQLTVTVLVYPALVDTATDSWTVVHAAHSRRIVPLVAAIYGALLLVGCWTAVVGPSPLGWFALVSTGAAMTVTAAAAAPLHGRLSGEEQRSRLLRVLVRADVSRCVFAVIGAAAALAAVAG